LIKEYYPEYNWPENNFIHNQKTLQKNINPTHCLRINFNGIEEGQFNVSIQNFSKYPVELHGLKYRKNKRISKLADPVILPPHSLTTVLFPLERGYRNLFTNKKKMKLGFDFREDLSKIKITYNLLGSSRLKEEIVLPWATDRKGYAASDPFQRQPNAHEFDFLVFDEKAKTITCPAGLWQLEQPMTIPPGYTFVAGPGCRIELLSRFISIFSFSPLRFIGTPERPVEIFSGTNYGGGILVLNNQDTSILKNCVFNNLSSPFSPGWSVTGAVNFYESDVRMEHCVFSNNRCEDALNVLRSHFDIQHTQFTDTKSDAFDGDFVTGSLRDCLFLNIGNDGIDVSGSNLQVERCIIKNAGDKGISAGENSHISASEIKVMDSEIAIASKDKSSFDIVNSYLENNRLCFTAFQKKPEFGPATIVADSIGHSGCQLEYLIENGSSLILDGREVETVQGVKGKMYGVEFGKSSK